MSLTSRLGHPKSLLGDFSLGVTPDDDLLTVEFDDSMTFVDSTAVDTSFEKTIFETLTLIEALTSKMVRLVPFSDTVSFSDTFVGVVAHPASDSVTFADSFSEFIVKKLGDDLEFGESLQYHAILKRSLADQIVFFDNLSYNATLRKTLSDTLTFTDSFSGSGTLPLVPDTIVFTDSVVGTRSVPLYETLVFVDNFATNKTQNRSMNDTFVFTDGTTEKKITNLAFEDTLIFIDEEDGVRVESGDATDSITFVDAFYRTKIAVLTTDTLTFSETLTAETDFERALGDSLVFTDSLVEHTSFDRTLSDVLVPADGFLIKIRRQLPTTPPPDTVNPIGGSGLYEGVTSVLSQVVIVGTTSSIILPPPEFNDFEGNQGKIAVQRSMTGHFRTYAKRTNKDRVNWRFVLPKFKADELEAFILAEINNPLDITDFKGNRWHAKILSDSVDFTETGRWSPCGNKVEVTIEYEGIQYA